MTNCTQCREDLANPEANYCGHCSFPILNDLSEEEVRERAREDLSGILDGFDVQTIQDTKKGDQEEPAEAYHWYLEERVKWAFSEIAFLQRWDWFDKGAVPRLLLQKEIFEDDPSDEAINDYIRGHASRPSSTNRSNPQVLNSASVLEIFS
jgi:hypothetical protein